MEKVICPRCGAENSLGMAFCTNCGQAFAPPVSDQSNAAMPAQISHSQAPTAIIPAAEPKKNNRNVIFGLAGCGTLLIVFFIGAIFIGAFIKLRDIGQSNANSIAANTNAGSNYANNKPPVPNSNIDNSNAASVEQINSSALDEVRSLKQVGAFRQTDVKEIPAGESYPSAAEAVQVTYQNGKQSVVSIVAQFPSSEAAISDFESRIADVKNGGGKIYNNLNKSGTQGSAYKYKEYYYIEVCGEAVCWRNYSDELNAVRTFATNFNSGSNKKRNR